MVYVIIVDCVLIMSSGIRYAEYKSFRVLFNIGLHDQGLVFTIFCLWHLSDIPFPLFIYWFHICPVFFGIYDILDCFVIFVVKVESANLVCCMNQLAFR